MKIYLAGALFNEAEVNQRLYEGRKLRENFSNIELFNPIEQPFNENKDKLPTPIEIFENDTRAVIDSDLVILDITNEDAGVMVELGIAISHNKKIIAINSDIRLKTANKYDIPTYGMNHFVLGAINKYGKLVYSFDEAIEELRKMI